MSNRNDEVEKYISAQLDKSSWWSRLSGSAFVKGIETFLAQIVSRNDHAGDRSLQESFLSLALNRSSILAGAEDIGYVGLRISPSWGQVRITNKSDKRLTLPAKTPVISKSLLYYIIENSIDLEPNEFVDTRIYQLWLDQKSIVISEPAAWFSVVLPVSTTAVAHEVDIYVNNELWANSYKFRNADPESKVYMEFYKPTEQLGYRFGDGIKGAIPPAGSTIRLDVWCTNGDTTLIDGQVLQLIDDNEHLNNSVDIVTTTSITGGAAQEDTETTRMGALYTTPFNDELVWRGDYTHFIKMNVAGIVWLSVWGEKDQERLVGLKDAKHINQIYICAYSNIKSDEALYAEILDLFKGRPEFNKEYRKVVRKELPFTISVSGTVFPHSNPSEAEKVIKAKLDSIYGKDSNKKPHRVLQQDIWDLINENVRDTGIDEFVLTLTNLPSNIPLDTYSYLDMTNSTVRFSYKDID